jgi:hypothetical protein
LEEEEEEEEEKEEKETKLTPEFREADTSCKSGTRMKERRQRHQTFQRHRRTPEICSVVTLTYFIFIDGLCRANCGGSREDLERTAGFIFAAGKTI